MAKSEKAARIIGFIIKMVWKGQYMKKKFKIPTFKSKKEEFQFFSDLDLSEYFEKTDFIPVSFPNLRHSTQSISLRLPEYILSNVKEQANTLDMSYQALIKKYIADGVRKDRFSAKIEKGEVFGK